MVERHRPETNRKFITIVTGRRLILAKEDLGTEALLLPRPLSRLSTKSVQNLARRLLNVTQNRLGRSSVSSQLCRARRAGIGAAFSAGQRHSRRYFRWPERGLWLRSEVRSLALPSRYAGLHQSTEYLPGRYRSGRRRGQPAGRRLGDRRERQRLPLQLHHERFRSGIGRPLTDRGRHRQPGQLPSL